MTIVLKLLSWITRNVEKFPGRWRVVEWLRGHEHELYQLPPARLSIGSGAVLEVEARNNRDVFIEGLSRNSPP